METEKNFFFDNYMIEEENKFAGEAVFHAITNIGKLYNPCPNYQILIKRMQQRQLQQSIYKIGTSEEGACKYEWI